MKLNANKTYTYTEKWKGANLWAARVRDYNQD